MKSLGQMIDRCAFEQDRAEHSRVLGYARSETECAEDSPSFLQPYFALIRNAYH